MLFLLVIDDISKVEFLLCQINPVKSDKPTNFVIVGTETDGKILPLTGEVILSGTGVIIANVILNGRHCDWVYLALP